MLTSDGKAMTLQEYRPVHTNALLTCSEAGSPHGENSVMMAIIMISECRSILGRQSWHTTFTQSISQSMYIPVFGTHQGNQQTMTGTSSDTKHKPDFACTAHVY